jgi:hypothetical protein
VSHFIRKEACSRYSKRGKALLKCNGSPKDCHWKSSTTWKSSTKLSPSSQKIIIDEISHHLKDNHLSKHGRPAPRNGSLRTTGALLIPIDDTILVLGIVEVKQSDGYLGFQVSIYCE